MKFAVVSVLLFAIVFDVVAPCSPPSFCPAIEINAAAIKANADNLNTQLGNLGSTTGPMFLTNCAMALPTITTITAALSTQTGQTVPVPTCEQIAQRYTDLQNASAGLSSTMTAILNNGGDATQETCNQATSYINTLAGL